MEINDIKFKSFDKLKDKYIGKIGTPERDRYEFDLKLDILGEMIKKSEKRKKFDSRTVG